MSWRSDRTWSAASLKTVLAKGSGRGMISAGMSVVGGTDERDTTGLPHVAEKRAFATRLAPHLVQHAIPAASQMDHPAYTASVDCGCAAPLRHDVTPR